ncbi:MAG TPA: serine/threonine-protein kinase, partial [Pyrinomonadaceae bacterium]|nr:serine/threonine-protein kinase [Pyrinomonadaceae bacterium]
MPRRFSPDGPTPDKKARPKAKDDTRISEQQPFEPLEPTVSLPSSGPNISAPDLSKGSPSVFGRYEVQRSLGKGGYGSVYLGRDTQLHRLVAIKVLHSRSESLQAEDSPSLREARKLARLHHPGIVTVHDVGVQDDQVYIVSDYLEGLDLGRWLQENRPSWTEAARIIATVADALAHAHARLIVHRDIKPANIILTSDCEPVVVDFGLALGEEEAL